MVLLDNEDEKKQKDLLLLSALSYNESMSNYIPQDTAVPVITIDGPSGAGKGTIAFALAQHLHWHFLDSGALYRSLAYLVKQTNTPVTAVDEIRVLAENLDLQILPSTTQRYGIWLRHREITSLIRAEEIGQIASKISVYPKVREALLACQRRFAQLPGLVADGRDMGTVVFQSAPLKIFLDASLQERAKRRYLELQTIGDTKSLQHIMKELGERDQRDSERKIAPLCAANDAITIDTTNLSIAAVIARVIE